MEELNKNQIVLLTLLVSFVTSIATGIVTVTLMDQAPAGVTQTVNRVVERTIERVVPGEPRQQIVVKEVPVQVTQEDLIQNVINKAIPSLVRIADREGANLGSGFMVAEEGVVVTAARLLPRLREGERYVVKLGNGEEVLGRLIKYSPVHGIASIKLDPEALAALKQKLLAAAGAATSTPVFNWQPLELAEGEVTLGQTVVALGMPDAGPPNVALGIVSGFGETEGLPSARLIHTNAANDLNSGGPTLNIKGAVVGLSQTSGAALEVKAIKQFLTQ